MSLVEKCWMITSNVSVIAVLIITGICFVLLLSDVSIDVLELINTLVVETYNYKGINEQTDFNKLISSDYPLFSDLLFIIENKSDIY